MPFPTPTDTTAVAAVFINTSEYQTSPATSATRMQPPHDGVVAVGGPAKSGAGPDCKNCGDAVTDASCSAPTVSYTSADRTSGA